MIEPSAGVDRGVLALLNEAYKEENTDKDNKRILLSLKPHLSPIKAAVIPLKKNNDELVNLSKEIKSNLQKKYGKEEIEDLVYWKYVSSPYLH